MSDYIFIGNSTKPSMEKLNDRSPVKLNNVSKPCISAAIGLGYKVILGINRNNPEELRCIDFPIKMYDSHTYRSIFAINDNYTAYKNLSKVIKNGNVDTIHCNTPVGGLVGRIAGKRYGIKTIIYTAHGFHFYKGAPLVNNTILKWAEHIMAHWTNAIITMNQEDFESANKMRLRKGGKVYKVHGVGITLSDYEHIEVDRIKKREKLGFKESDIVCISAGDLVKRKNYKVAIEAISKTKRDNIHYIICGVGPEEEKLRVMANELGIKNQIHFLGFRTDVKELMKISDIFLLTSMQEGLPRSLMEAMALGLPVVVSKIRGNVDLIEDGIGGYLVEPTDSDMFSMRIKQLSDDLQLIEKMSLNNLDKIKEYDISIVEKEIRDIYSDIML